MGKGSEDANRHWPPLPWGPSLKIESTSLWPVCRAGCPITQALIMPPEASPMLTNPRIPWWGLERAMWE